MAGVAVFAVFAAAQADGYSGTLTDETDHGAYRNLFGEAGLLDLPSARMAKDGTLAFTVGSIKENQRYNLTFQALPWLEAAFRFSSIDSNYYDRSFSFKARLWQEGKYRPAIAIGVRDLLGSGVYAGEYLVASKKFGDFDLTGGMGWGRFANRDAFYNPLRLASDKFKNRISGLTGTTGRVEFNEFFRGPVGIFGGVSWQTPIDGLRLMAEYSGDEYQFEQGYGPNQVRTHSPVNIGFSWRPLQHVQLSGAYMYGNTYGLVISFDGNLGEDTPTDYRLGPSLPPPVIRDPAAQHAAMQQVLQDDTALSDNVFALRRESERAHGNHQVMTLDQTRQAANDAILQNHEITSLDGGSASGIHGPIYDWLTKMGLKNSRPKAIARQAVAKLKKTHVKIPAKLKAKIRADLDQQHIFFHDIVMDKTDAWIWYFNGKYRDEDQALGRIIRVMLRDLPPNIEYFHMVSVQHGLTEREVTVPRSSIERLIVNYGTTDEIAAVTQITDPAYTDEIPGLKQAIADELPDFTFTYAPKMAEHTFDPNNPLQLLFYFVGSAEVNLAPGWTVSASASANIWNDYNHRSDNSQLPHVRSDILKYVHQGKYGLSNLELDYRSRIGADLYAMAKVGYLEDMYAGFGGQVLWRPQGWPVAFGADLYQVWKRNFNRQLGLRNYDVLTGHVSAYIQLPWYGLNFNIHAGRYLAKDYGATFELTRRFNTGVEVGAFATFTNVPFSKFGEGSFDKGIIIRIPTQWGLPFFTQAEYNLHLSSLTRDGGQRLAGDNSLYRETSRTSYDEISRHYDDLTHP